MVKVTVWFDHREGPYPWKVDFNSVEACEECYREDPAFIGIQAEGEEVPPVVAEYYEGREVPG